MLPPAPPPIPAASPARPGRRGLRRARPEPAQPVRPVDAGPQRRRRRWWLRKRLLLPLGLLALVILLGDRGQDTPPAAGGSQLGVPVRDGNLEFVVSQVRCGVTQVGTGLLRRTPEGQFCLARMRVTNVKTGARTLYEPVQKLVDTAGGKHAADLGIRVIYRDQTLWDKIEPGKEVSGTMVFDIPRDTRPDHLELHDGIASGGVTVRLR